MADQACHSARASQPGQPRFRTSLRGPPSHTCAVSPGSKFPPTQGLGPHAPPAQVEPTSLSSWAQGQGLTDHGLSSSLHRPQLLRGSPRSALCPGDFICAWPALHPFPQLHVSRHHPLTGGQPRAFLHCSSERGIPRLQSLLSTPLGSWHRHLMPQSSLAPPASRPESDGHSDVTWPLGSPSGRTQALLHSLRGPILPAWSPEPFQIGL